MRGLLTLTAFMTGLFLCAGSPADYSGENLLLVIGTNVNSREFKEFKQFWWLNKNFESQKNGIKLTVDHVSELTEEVLLAGNHYETNGVIFSKCSMPLPYQISWDDDTLTLASKLNYGQKLIGRNTMRYYENDICVEIEFENLAKASIKYIRFYQDVRPTPPQFKEEPMVKKESARDIIREETRAQVSELHEAIHPVEQKEVKVYVSESLTPLKQSILNVFESYRASNFYNIKTDETLGSNYWNYKYTYKTTIKIPGEKSNMVYSFPFQDSQLDFVSVLREANSIDRSFEATYREFLKKLSENFPPMEGWVMTSSPNKGNKSMADIEWKNDNYGSVILDYCQNPQGRHVLFLRFLPYSN